MKQKDDAFRGVIPGISLTKEPGSYPWERPPEMEDPDQVIDFYLDRFSDPDNLEKAMMVLEADFPLRALVEGMLSSGVSRGLHTIDMSMIVAPVVHEFLKGQAEATGIEFDEGLENKQQKEKQQKLYSKIRLMKEVEKINKDKQSEEAEDFSDEIFEPADTPMREGLKMEEEPIQEEPKKGLMARRGSS